MSSAIVWAIFPFFAGVLLIPLVRFRRVVYLLSTVVAGILAILAALTTISEPVNLGFASIKLDPSISILGRTMVLDQADQTILVLLYTFSTFWLVGGRFAGTTTLLAPSALIITSLLVASFAVEPFLYAALMIEGVVLVSIPLLSQAFTEPNPGVVRYLVFQTIGMPFLLITGWLLSGIETAPSDPAEVIQIIIFLGVGFAFILAIFPLYSWIPMLAEEEDTFLTGYIFLLLQSGVLFFLLTFIDHYSWLRESVDLPRILQYAGILMIITGGLWSGFQRNMARMFGFAVIVENGFAILALGLMTIRGYELFANMLLARMLSFGLWSLSLSIIRSKVGSLDLQQNRGLARAQPLLAVSILAAQFSIGGLPLFAGFPIRISLIEELSMQSPALAWLLIIGIGGVWAGGIYSLFVFLQRIPTIQVIPFRSRVIPGLLVLGIASLVFLGLFPHLVSPMVVDMLRAYPRLMSLP